MAAELTHDDLRELLGAYALDAVDGQERAAIERHLGGCAACLAEVGAHRETAALLGEAGAPAPPHVWDRISAALPEGLGRPDELSAARERRGSRWGGWLVAAGVAAVVAVFGVKFVQQDGRIEELRGAAARVPVLERALAVALDPAAQPVELRAPAGDQELQVVLLPDGEGLVTADNLRPLPPERTYQLWALVCDRAPVSAAVLGADPGLTSFTAPSGLDGLAVTEEPAGGAATPQGTPLLSGSVPGE
jgi:anti-sigma-K factor RskA